MKKIFGVISILVLVALFLPAQAVVAQDAVDPLSLPPPPAGCTLAPQGGDIILLCNPANKPDWIIFAHGFVPTVPGMDLTLNLALAFEQLKLPDGTMIPTLVNSLGYGFAAPTYDRTGLAVTNGVQSVTNLALAIKSQNPSSRIYLVGASEGGLISTLIAEQATTPFNGVVAACGPIGDFRKHVNYLGDFRVLFDYFFPKVFVDANGHISPINIPVPVIGDWLNGSLSGNPANSQYQSAVVAAMTASPSKSLELMRTSKAAYDPNDLTTIGLTALKALNYDIVENNDAQVVLGVQPFTNQRTWYFGSANDLLLNKLVERVPPLGQPYNEAATQAALAGYQTTGKLKRPLVTIQTLLDPEVPAWHQTLYRLKVYNQRAYALYSGIPILRYGHCNFKPEELVLSFYLMVYKTTGRPMSINQLKAALPDPASFEAFQSLKNSVDSGTMKTDPVAPSTQ
jgi:pimeloyl-ACP methyl ester carboxylesterase